MPQINLTLDRRLFNDCYYADLFDYSHRYTVYYGGAASGKSVAITQKLILKLAASHRKLLVVRKVARTLKDSVFQLFCDLLSQWHLLSLCTINKTTLDIAFPNGSVILFKGLDDAEKIKSIAGITDIWAEEASEITLDEFQALDLRLRAKRPNLQFFLTFNPVSKANWTYDYFFVGQQPPNTFVLHTTYRDNKFLPQQYIDALQAMEKTNPTYYRIYALGEFCSLDKLIYPNWRQSMDNETPSGTLIVGLDFGYVNDPSALIVAYADVDAKKIYVVDEVYKTGMLNDEIATLIKYKNLQKEIIIADSAEQKSIEEIKRLGISRIRPAVKGQGSILQGIQRLQQFEIIVSPQCTNTIIELQNYSWQKDKSSGEYTNQPIDTFNHALDALRYAIQAVDRPNKLLSLPKNLLF